MKRSRGWRITQKKRVVDNRLNFLKEIDKDRVKYFEDKKNKLAVKHPCDCGRTDCGVCSAHKRRGCSKKLQDEHGILEEIIRKETVDDLSET